MKKQKLANVSPWLLAAASALLFLVIAVFAANNYSREKKLMSEALVRQGQTIIHFVVADARASLRGNMLNIQMTGWQWTDHLQQAIDNSAAQQGVIFLGLIDENGKVLAATGKQNVNDTVDDSTLSFLQTVFDSAGSAPVNRIKKNEEEKDSVFQIAAHYHPFFPQNFSLQRRGFGGMIQTPFSQPRRFGGRSGRRMAEEFQQIRNNHYALLVELDLSEFNQAVKRQLLQILSLSVVLLLVGCGGWLSLLTLQGLKGSQSRLRQIRRFTDQLVASLPVGLIATDDEGDIRIVNQSAEKMVGINEHEVIGMTPMDCLPKRLSYELTTRHDVLEPKEISLYNNEDVVHSLLIMSVPLIDKNDIFKGNILLIQDLSQIKELQHEVRRNERLAALGKMAAGVAHELRNPLSSIKGLALLLKSKLKQDQEGIEAADILVKEVERLNRSIGELLDYARPYSLQRENSLLSKVVDKSVSLISADLESADIQLQTEYMDTCLIDADVDKLNQVFLNLIINAVQAIETEGEIIIRTYCNDREAICEVRDNGKGLKREDVSRVFDPYFTTKSKGTGLGLSLSAKIIEAHDGKIEFSSIYGAGTCIKVTIPRLQEEI